VNRHNIVNDGDLRLLTSKMDAHLGALSEQKDLPGTHWQF
jgi:hypothetical protein